MKRTSNLNKNWEISYKGVEWRKKSYYHWQGQAICSDQENYLYVEHVSKLLGDEKTYEKLESNKESYTTHHLYIGESLVSALWHRSQCPVIGITLNWIETTHDQNVESEFCNRIYVQEVQVSVSCESVSTPVAGILLL